MINFSEVRSVDDLYRQVGRSVLAGFSVSPIDFAAVKSGAKKSQKCNPSRSHGCVRVDGTTYCISLNKKCRMGVKGKAKQAANYIKSMALSTDANVVTQSQIGREILAVKKGIEKWAKDERFKLAVGDPKKAAKIQKDFKGSLVADSDMSIRLVNSQSRRSGKLIAEDGQLRIPKKDGSGFVDFPVVRLSTGTYVLKNDDGTVGERFPSRDKAVKAIKGILSEREVQKIGGAADPKKIAEIDRKAAAMREVLIGDNGSPPSSGRFAVIRGYDAISLDQSYEKNTFMNLLNRSKVMVQDTNLSYADASKRGVAP